MKNKTFKIYARIILGIVLILAVIFFASLFILDVLPVYLSVLAAFVTLVLFLAFAFYMLKKKKSKASKTVCFILSLVLAFGFGVGDFYLFKTYNMFNIVSKIKGEVLNTVGVYTLKDSEINQEQDLKNKNIGVLSHIDAMGRKSMEEYLRNESIDHSETEYNSIPSLVSALYNKEVDGIVVNESYLSNIKDLEDYRFFDSETKKVAETTFYTSDNNEPIVVDDITREPFTILVSGIDTYGEVSTNSRSDVNLLVTINPKTETVLLTSLPRDTYTPMVCAADDDCPNGALDKLTHAGMHGVQTSKKTIEELLGITINYTFRVNFSSVIDIVNSLGGVDVFVEDGLAVRPFFTNENEVVDEGWNHLSGDGALAFARERYAYIDGDNQRIRNQRIVLKAIIDKAISSQMLVSYSNFMDALSSSFETNLTQKEMTALIQFQLQNMPDWKFYEYSVYGENADMISAELGDVASVVLPNEYSLQIARENIENVLAGKEVVENTPADSTGVGTQEGAVQPQEEDAQEDPGLEETPWQEQPAQEDTNYEISGPVYQQPNYEDIYYGPSYDESYYSGESSYYY